MFKKELILFFNYSHKILIDCEELANSRNQSEMIVELAKQLGYFPIFTWIASMGKLIDTMIAASTGQTAGIASSPEAQIQNILEAAAIALRKVSPDELLKEDNKPKKKGIAEGVERWFYKKFETADDTRDPQEIRKDIPIVVLDNFMYRETSMTEHLWTELANFAGLLVENEVAHVVIVSSNVAVTKILSKGKKSDTR